MRTVHETEALRPSDPVPKSQALSSIGSTATPKIQRIKLKLTTQPKEEAEPNINGEGVVDPEDLDAIPLPEFGPELGFDEHELSLRPQELYRLLRRQIHWAELEMAKLRQEWEEKIEPQRFEAWRAKEAVLDDVIDAEQRLYNVLVEQEEKNAFPNGHDQQHQNGVDSTTQAEAVSA